MQKTVRFYINRAKGLKKDLLKNHPNLNERLLNKFVKAMQSETYIFDCCTDDTGSSTLNLYDVERNRLQITQQEMEIRNILRGCEEFAKNGGALPTAVTGYQIITE